eukprot:7149465-Prymnesium_polylepis.1
MRGSRHPVSLGDRVRLQRVPCRPQGGTRRRNVECFSTRPVCGCPRCESCHSSIAQAFETVPTHGRRPWGG